MGIKSLNKNESYYNFFGASGVDAVNPERAQTPNESNAQPTKNIK